MGSRRRQVTVEPLEVDAVRVVAIGTVLWAVAFVVALVLRDRLDAADRGWWLWSCLAGVGLGLLGIDLCRRQRDRRHRGGPGPAPEQPPPFG